MHYHSDITNAFGDIEKKDVYCIGELVVTYVSESRMYQYGLVIEIAERNWVNEKHFKNFYKILIQDNGSSGNMIVERYCPDIYLPHMRQILNQELIVMRNRSTLFAEPEDREEI